MSDVPSPIDLTSMEDALTWATEAGSKRPYRRRFFEAIAEDLTGISASPIRVLELGSGPGFLAECVLNLLTDVEYTLLDFSPAMHELAQTRLNSRDQCHFVVRNLKSEDWSQDLGRFDAVVTIQAVHELRHKRYAPQLHATVRGLLQSDGVYLVCDHFAGEGGMSDRELYMTIPEQRLALEQAAFSHVRHMLTSGSLTMHKAAY